MKGDSVAGRDEVAVDVPAGSAREARRFITDALAAWQLNHLARLAVVVGHELIVNALRHGRPPTLLRLRRGNDCVLIEVRDESSVVPHVPEIDNATSTSGRGLRIVNALAHRWGVRHHRGGKVVWAEVSGAKMTSNK